MALLELKNITRHFKNGQVKTEVLKGINLTVEKGEFLSIMGPSGSGKSTLLNIIGCLDRPSSGSYRLADRQVEKLNDGRLAEIRNQFIGFVFQGFHLLHDLDAQSNVELPLIYRGIGGKERKRRALEALEAVGLSHRRKHRPTQLSGGEQQRVAIARAIAGNPELLLADEPTGALDSKNGQNIMDIFKKLNEERGITIVQVTHEENIAMQSHRILNLFDGEVANEEKEVNKVKEVNEETTEQQTIE